MKIPKDLLNRRVESVLPSKPRLAKLLKNKKIRLYQGFDPTATRLHIGNAIGLKKLMEFANAGHEVIFLFGTGTVLAGDPSQRDTGRKLITEKEIENNIKDWKNQVGNIVDFSKVKILRNGDWLTKLTIKDIVFIGSKISAIQLFKRDSFQKRIEKGDPVWYHETMYPLLQGYDSVVMDVDLEIGGTDQEFNMLVGRELQKKINNREKYVLTIPLLPGTDGRKMSKSYGNAIWLNDKPNDIYGKVMSLSDELIVLYFRLATDVPSKRIDEIEKGLEKKKVRPVDAKKELAYNLVLELHSKNDADIAQKHFEKTFQEKSPNFETPIFLKDNAADTIIPFLDNPSASEYKRYISQGAISVNGKKVADPNIKLKPGQKIKIGKKVFGTITKRPK